MAQDKGEYAVKHGIIFRLAILLPDDGVGAGQQGTLLTSQGNRLVFLYHNPVQLARNHFLDFIDGINAGSE